MNRKLYRKTEKARDVSVKEAENEIIKCLRETLFEMGYTSRDTSKIIYNLRRKLYSHSEPVPTYKNTKTPASVKIMGMTVPRKFYDMKVADFKYSTDKMATRIANALGRSAKIIVLGDFIDKDETTRELIGITNIGAAARREFSEALKQVIGGN
jgi:hypothetical protein